MVKKGRVGFDNTLWRTKDRESSWSLQWVPTELLCNDYFFDQSETLSQRGSAKIPIDFICFQLKVRGWASESTFVCDNKDKWSACNLGFGQQGAKNIVYEKPIKWMAANREKESPRESSVKLKWRWIQRCGCSLTDTLQLKWNFIALHHLDHNFPADKSANTPQTSEPTRRCCRRWSQTSVPFVSAFKVNRKVVSEASGVGLAVQNSDAFHFPGLPSNTGHWSHKPPVSCYPDSRAPIMNKLSARSSSVSVFESGLTNTSAALTSWTAGSEAPRPSPAAKSLCNLFSLCDPIQRWRRSRHDAAVFQCLKETVDVSESKQPKQPVKCLPE